MMHFYFHFQHKSYILGHSYENGYYLIAIEVSFTCKSRLHVIFPINTNFQHQTFLPSQWHI